MKVYQKGSEKLPVGRLHCSVVSSRLDLGGQVLSEMLSRFTSTAIATKKTPFYDLHVCSATFFLI